MKNIVLFGGTFDPIHRGHTVVADCARKRIDAEKVVFIPAKRSPLKIFLPMAGDAQRLEMIALAIADNPRFEVSDCELVKHAPSYTIDTVRAFQRSFGDDAVIHWLVGADSVDDLPLWYAITDLIDECRLCTMFRAGCEKPDFSRYEPVWGRERVEKLRQNVIETPLVDISSTMVRECIAAGSDPSALLHPDVAQYIRQNALYQSKNQSQF